MLLAYIISHMKIRDYLQQNGIKVSDFADSIGKSRQAVYEWMWETKRPADEKTYALIFEATNGQVTANDFFNVPITKTLTPLRQKSNSKININ